jgi:hypothetical protein
MIELILRISSDGTEQGYFVGNLLSGKKKKRSRARRVADRLRAGGCRRPRDCSCQGKRAGEVIRPQTPANGPTLREVVSSAHRVIRRILQQSGGPRPALSLNGDSFSARVRPRVQPTFFADCCKVLLACWRARNVVLTHDVRIADEMPPWLVGFA